MTFFLSETEKKNTTIIMRITLNQMIRLKNYLKEKHLKDLSKIFQQQIHLVT